MHLFYHVLCTPFLWGDLLSFTMFCAPLFLWGDLLSFMFAQPRWLMSILVTKVDTSIQQFWACRSPSFELFWTCEDCPSSGIAVQVDSSANEGSSLWRWFRQGLCDVLHCTFVGDWLLHRHWWLTDATYFVDWLLHRHWWLTQFLYVVKVFSFREPIQGAIFFENGSLLINGIPYLFSHTCSNMRYYKLR